MASEGHQDKQHRADHELLLLCFWFTCWLACTTAVFVPDRPASFAPVTFSDVLVRSRLDKFRAIELPHEAIGFKVTLCLWRFDQLEHGRRSRLFNARFGRAWDHLGYLVEPEPTTTTQQRRSIVGNKRLRVLA